MPSEILSDRGRTFLSGFMLLLGYHKVNTTAYHPQTDGSVERYKRTLTSMLAKTVSRGPELDDMLPYVLFAYRATEQSSTGESPFFLQGPQVTRSGDVKPQDDLKEYGIELHAKMSL